MAKWSSVRVAEKKMHSEHFVCHEDALYACYVGSFPSEYHDVTFSLFSHHRSLLVTSMSTSHTWASLTPPNWQDWF